MINWRAKNKKHTLFIPPDFLCIGAQKSGTTWLYENLKIQPDFEMPPYKELHYFNKILTRTLTMRSLKVFKNRRLLKMRISDNLKAPSIYKLKWDINYLFGKRTDAWYLSLFQRPVSKLAGDISPAYSTLDEPIVRHIRRLFPAIKVIYILRNPINRAWSHAKMDFIRFRKKKIQDLSIKEIIDHIDSRASILRSDYIRTINIWSRYFNSEQFLICFYDDIESRPGYFLSNILSFLKVEANSVKSSHLLNTKINESVNDKLPPSLRWYLAKKYSPTIHELHKMFGSRVQPWLAGL